jgi:hypothetical protein
MFNDPFAKNATDEPSGAQKGCSAPAVPGTAFPTPPAIGWIHNVAEPSGLRTIMATEEPSGETTGAWVSTPSDPAGVSIVTAVRLPDVRSWAMPPAQVRVVMIAMAAMVIPTHAVELRQPW